MFTYNFIKLIIPFTSSHAHPFVLPQSLVTIQQYHPSSDGCTFVIFSELMIVFCPLNFDIFEELIELDGSELLFFFQSYLRMACPKARHVNCVAYSGNTVAFSGNLIIFMQGAMYIHTINYYEY